MIVNFNFDQYLYKVQVTEDRGCEPLSNDLKPYLEKMQKAFNEYIEKISDPVELKDDPASVKYWLFEDFLYDYIQSKEGKSSFRFDMLSDTEMDLQW